MKHVRWLARWHDLVMVIWLFFFFFVSSFAKTPVRETSRTNNGPSPGVQLHTENPKQVVIDNGIIQVTLTRPQGEVIGIKYHGIDNVLATENEDDDRGYWDLVWSKPGNPNAIDKLLGTEIKVITQHANQVEVSFTRKWNNSASMVPLNVDKRYIVRRGQSGIYVYAVLERLKGWPDVDMDQIRTVFKLQQNRFHFMQISDTRKRVMPMPEDRKTGQPLAYPEAVLLTKPMNPEFRGEVDDKYQYSNENRDNKVHGWISENASVGFWMITPSSEFRCGGPIKQELTSHVGPTVLSMFTSIHYAGKDMDTEYRNGEPWKKVLGPVYVYLNSVPPKEPSSKLWDDAKRQVSIEVSQWPYNFPRSADYPSKAQRGTVSGQLLVRDRYINAKLMNAKYAFVGLAAPGTVGSWQTEAKGYQFWTRADNLGRFVIENVRPGTYSLYAWVPHFIGDYKYNSKINIKPGSKIRVGNLIFEPPRNGPTLWEIGIPDRTAAEFFVPSTYPTLLNRLYTKYPTEKFRQYGLWERYADLYPKGDLIYTVGASNIKDWFFAQVNRKKGNSIYEATTWQIIFHLQNVNPKGSYTLQLALASATSSEILVRFNNPNANRPLFTTGLVGKDNAIARHGIHGLYRLFSIHVPGSQLVRGKNTIYLTQSRKESPFFGVMYDYIRLEGPRSS